MMKNRTYTATCKEIVKSYVIGVPIRALSLGKNKNTHDVVPKN